MTRSSTASICGAERVCRSMAGPLACAFMLAACGDVPANRYGIDRIRLEGMETMDEDALRACLSISERPRAGLNFAVQSAGSCGEAPFDAGRTELRLWAWPWTEWPLFDRVALTQDLRRIERWYAARGFHGAEVEEVVVLPEAALSDDTLPAEEPEPSCERLSDDEGCSVEVTIRIQEGAPTLLTEITLRGHESLPSSLRRTIEGAVELEVGERFDEATYDATKRAIAAALAEEGYARARILGEARVDRPNRTARVDLHVESGPLCTFGELHIEGADDLPLGPIADATRIDPGEEFSLHDVQEAQKAVFGLGAFSGVVVEPMLETDANPDPSVIDVRVTVTPARRHRFGLGGGVQSGVVTRGDSEPISVPLWDLHLKAQYENRNMLGGLRRLRLEERPRMIIQEPFPSFDRPRFGNVLSAELRQPGFLEARTTLVAGAEHEFGPDPFDTFFRHRVDGRLSVERNFWQHRIFASLGWRASFYRVPSDELTNAGEEPPSDYDLMYLEQVVRLDLRDDPNRPHAGFFMQLRAQEAGFFLRSSWDYVRLTPDVRAYIPLPKRITIAARFAMGMYFIRGVDPDIDETSAALGPRDLRIRGGGASSNRGYLAGRLGDGTDGGTRRWEASLEMRFPVTADLGAVLFADVGDVSRDPNFRFDHPQTSVGLGLRYFTIVGPIRFDIAWQIRDLAVVGNDERIRSTSDDTEVNFGLFRFPGAYHISIGESF